MSLLEDNLTDLDPLGTEEVADETSAPAPRTLLTFRLGPLVFGVSVEWVREIVDMTTIAPIPGAPHDVLGMIDLRSETIPIMDLSQRLGLSAVESGDARIIVFSFDQGNAPVSLGVLADQVLRVCEVSSDSAEPLPDTKTGWQSEDIDSLVRTDDGSVLVLAIDRILCRKDTIPGDFDFG